MSDPRLYYLSNFRTALGWIEQRHADLLDADEQAFLAAFASLPQASQGLLVRLLMRQGPHFRASRLDYPELGETATAAAPLLALGWLDDHAPVERTALLTLLRKDELLAAFPHLRAWRTARKAELLEHLPDGPPRALAEWCPELAESLYSLRVGELCERLRLLFFGNLRQDWSAFVLAELGIQRYPQVAFGEDSRAFRQRRDLDDYLRLHQAGSAFEAGEAVTAVLARIAPFDSANPWLQERHAKLRFRLARQLERDAALVEAEALYANCRHPQARARRARVLELLDRHQQALALAREALAAPVSEAEAQQLERLLARLERRLGLARRPPPRAAGEAQRIELLLPRSPHGVERAVREHLQQAEAPVHYVENSLVCGLFGLLCWEALFAPLPGAFFHPFQAAPADLLAADFHERRRELFETCLGYLRDGSYAQRIRATHAAMQGLQAVFIDWSSLTVEVLEQALLCLPAEHLEAWFRRLLGDLRGNRAGMPDLIQFWPGQRRYRMIEVKGPGDRLQDNQKRWLAFCLEHGMPVAVCQVRWLEPA